MTTLPVLAKDEINEICLLNGVIFALEELISKTKFQTWKTSFENAHGVFEKIMVDRFKCFKGNAGALKRIGDQIEGTRVLFMQKGNNYIKGNEEEFKNRVAADDMYKLAEICQAAQCQNCTKCKDTCDLYELFHKYGFEKFDIKKGICPYSVTLCEES